MANFLPEPHYKKLHSGSIVTVEESKAMARQARYGTGNSKAFCIDGPKVQGNRTLTQLEEYFISA